MTRSTKNSEQMILTSDVVETYISNGATITLVKSTLTYPADAKINESEFTLSHYGITEPADDVYEDRRFNWPLWVGIGVGLLVLSVILAWIARRRIRSQSGD